MRAKRACVSTSRHTKGSAKFDGRDWLRRDQQEQLELAKGKVVERFLDVADNLDQYSARPNGRVVRTYSGVELVHKMFDQALTELGLEKHDPKGEAFDPVTMEANGMMPVADPPCKHSRPYSATRIPTQWTRTDPRLYRWATTLANCAQRCWKVFTRRR